MRLPAVEVASYDVELEDDEPRYVPRSLDADAFRTSDWHRPNCRAIREGVTPALKLPEWHLADGVNDGGAPTCPGEMMAGRSGTVVPGSGLQNCGPDLIFVCSRFTNFASRPVKPGESNWATRHDVNGSKCVDGVTMFLE